MENIKKVIENSKRILITSHKNCDQDGISSALATKLIIEKNFSNKEILVNIESELQKNISFLKGFEEIEKENLFEKVNIFKPNLIIFTDSSSFSRFTSKNFDLEKYKTILIDHHKTPVDFKVDFHYNNHRTSCAQEVFQLFIKEMKLDFDSDIAEVILTGMIFDTGVFVYENHAFRETATVVADLVEKGGVIEKILSFKDVYTEKDFEVFTELNKNLVVKKTFVYSFITESFFRNSNLKPEEYKNAYQKWGELFLKNINGCKWGFIVRPNYEKTYSVTLRSTAGSQNVRLIAEQFGGGGHNNAAGFDINAKNIESVVEKIIGHIL